MWAKGVIDSYHGIQYFQIHQHFQYIQTLQNMSMFLGEVTRVTLHIIKITVILSVYKKATNFLDIEKNCSSQALFLKLLYSDHVEHEATDFFFFFLP